MTNEAFKQWVHATINGSGAIAPGSAAESIAKEIETCDKKAAELYRGAAKARDELKVYLRSRVGQ